MTINDLAPLTVLTNMGQVTGSSTMQFVTRWQMGNTIYYAMMETNAGARQANGDMYYAGAAQSIDLCSVSACDPHVIYYPEAGVGANSETGSVVCTTTCTITININAAHIGSPNQTSLLEEVGSYAFGSARQMSLITNPQAEADQLPLEIDGICCFNFSATQLNANVPEAPWTALLLGVGAALVGVGVFQSRRRRRHSVNQTV